jgi:hypothetical protein
VPPRQPRPTQESPILYGGTHFVAGPGLPAISGDGRAWSFPAGVKADKAQVAKLAKVLGVSGSPAEMPSDAGGGWTMGDLATGTLMVASDPTLLWSYNPSAEVWSTVGGCSVTPTTVSSSAGAANNQPPSDGMISPNDPSCVPHPPKNVPTEAKARAMAKKLFAALGYADLEYEFESDEGWATVSGYQLLDGLRMPLSMTVTYGENGQMTGANGILATPKQGDLYPLIDGVAGIARLNAQNLPGVDGGVWAMQKDPGAVAPGAEPASDPAMSKGVQMPVGEATTLTLVQVKHDLSLFYGQDETLWLLPAYTYSTAEGNNATVAAVPDEFIQSVQPAISVPMTAPPVTTLAPTSIPTTVAPIAGSVLVGLTEADATAKAKSFGWTLRVSRRDGEDLFVTADYSQSRVNVGVAKGIVTEVFAFG